MTEVVLDKRSLLCLTKLQDDNCRKHEMRDLCNIYFRKLKLFFHLSIFNPRLLCSFAWHYSSKSHLFMSYWASVQLISSSSPSETSCLLLFCAHGQICVPEVVSLGVSALSDVIQRRVGKKCFDQSEAWAFSLQELLEQTLTSLFETSICLSK